VTTKTVIPIPTGVNNIRIFEAGTTYCSNCEETYDSDDWTSGEVFEPESLANWVSSFDPIETDSEMTVSYLFGDEGIKVLVKMECPNGCAFYGGEGDEWWHIGDAQYVCTGCDEWYGHPHDALVCCANCSDVSRDDCHCANMVQTNGQGVPELIAGQPLSRCNCGGGECDQVVCLLCHDHWNDGSVDVNGHMTLRHRDEEWELATPVLGLDEEWEQVNFSRQNMDDNTMSTTQRTSKCEICGTYCCAIHHTHSTPHQFCWEGK
jgi:hypothetical protein